MNPGKQLVKGSALAWMIYPENFTACRIKHPETEGSFLSDLAGMSLCTGIIFAIFQLASDTAPFQNKAGRPQGTPPAAFTALALFAFSNQTTFILTQVQNAAVHN